MASRLIPSATNNRKPMSKVTNCENDIATRKSHLIGNNMKQNKEENENNVRISRSNSSSTQRVPLSNLNSNVVKPQPTLQWKQKDSLTKTTSVISRGIKASQPPAPVSSQAFIIHEDECEQTSETEVINVSTDDILSDKISELDHPSAAVASVRKPFLTLSLNHDQQKVSPIVEDMSLCSDANDKENVVPNQIVTEPESKQQVPDLVGFMVSEYDEEIYAYLMERQLSHRPKPTYMKKQPDITDSMRSILIDWLVEVAEEYKLQSETLFLAVTYIDRFLSCMSVLKSKLQLVGTASMLIAAKFEEIYPPDVDEFVYITDDTYTKSQVLRMEQVILRVLKFNLVSPTIHYFLQRFCALACLNDICRNLAMYISELSLLEADPYLQFLPSEIAVSAVYLACSLLEQTLDDEEVMNLFGYSVKNLKIKDCLRLLYKSFCNASQYPQQAVREKYCSQKYLEVANIFPPVTLTLLDDDYM